MKISIPGYTTTLHRYYLERKLKVILPRLKGPILDAGSKSRRYDYLLCEKPTAIDLVENKNHDIQKGDINALSFENDSFRSVMCIEVLEYVHTPERALEELSRVISPGGTLVLTVPFMYREHGDSMRYTESYLKEKTSLFFSHVESVPIGNFYTTIFDILVGKIKEVPFSLVRYMLYMCAIPFFVCVPLSLCSKDRRYASGYCIVAVK